MNNLLTSIRNCKMMRLLNRIFRRWRTQRQQRTAQGATEADGLLREVDLSQSNSQPQCLPTTNADERDGHSSHVRPEEIEVDGRISDFIKKAELLSSGGFAKVYKAKHILIKETVAVKMIPLDRYFSIKSEVDMVRHLKHENIVQLKAVYGSANCIGLVMELMSLDLATLIFLGTSSLEEDVEMAIMHEVLQGLAYLHAQRIVHNDIKPENILIRLSSSVTVKICDFGFSFKTDEQAFLDKGTPPYTAPEVFRHVMRETSYVPPTCGEPLGPERDVWSLGVTMMVVATKELPEDCEHAVNLLAMTNFQLADRLRMHDISRKPDWIEVVDSCLQVDTRLRATAWSLLSHPKLEERADLEFLRHPVYQTLMMRQRSRSHR